MNVHDNVIVSYEVHCEAKRIVLHTQYRDKEPHEFTDVIFEGVVAHHFEHALDCNILFDITECEVANIVTQNQRLFDEAKNYSWPVSYKTRKDLFTQLEQRNIRGFCIQSSYGLGGWVLATEMKSVDVGVPV